MHDLPVFIQMFLRLFAILGVGLWMQILSTPPDQQKKDKDNKALEQQANPATQQTSVVQPAPENPAVTGPVP